MPTFTLARGRCRSTRALHPARTKPRTQMRGFYCAPSAAPSVAAPVRARKTRFKPGSRVCTTHTGAQWTARPTLLSAPLRLWAETGARPSWPQLTPLSRTGLRSFWGVRKWRTRENGEAAVLSAVLFLRAWTPARLWQGLSRAVAALVRARKIRFKPKSRVRTTNCGRAVEVDCAALPTQPLCPSAVKNSCPERCADAAIAGNALQAFFQSHALVWARNFTFAGEHPNEKLLCAYVSVPC